MRSHAGVAKTMFELLSKENINIQLISTSEIKISCVIARKYAELAVRTLHDGFDLSLPPSERAGLYCPWAGVRTAGAGRAAAGAGARGGGRAAARAGGGAR